MKLLSLILALAPLSLAQLPPPNAAGVSMGHIHLNVRDIDESKKFFVDLLGGKPKKLGAIDMIEFPGALIALKKADPSGGSEGSVVNHIGFLVRDINECLTRLKAASVKVLSENPANHQAFILSPDGLKIELYEDKTISAPTVNHHIHFFDASIEDTKAWYVKTFTAKPGKRAIFEAADVPGVNLSFSLSDKPVVPTKGRVLDHIGFEIKNLEAFCQKLEASGVKFDITYRKVPSLGIAIAFLTDPFGTTSS